MLFLEDYDLQLGRWLTAGVDVWLNNPIAPLEASGTSGMKAAANGRLNLSILDGWWDEGWAEDNGWGIPPVNVQDPDRRDSLEAEFILATLEDEVVPLYYARDAAGVSTDWVRRCKRAIATVVPAFNMRRMLNDYLHGMYLPAARKSADLNRDGFAGARQLAEWKQRIRSQWGRVALRSLDLPERQVPQGTSLKLRVAAFLNGLQPADVRVEFVARRQLPEADFEPPLLSSYRPKEQDGLWCAELVPTGEVDSDGSFVFALDARAAGSGQFATEVRVYPRHELLSHPFEMGMMKWL